MPSSDPLQLKSSACQVAYGGEVNNVRCHGSPPWLAIALEPLAGDDHETLLAAAGAATMRDDIWLFPGHDLSGGFGLARPDLTLEAATTDLYWRLFAATEGLHLYRLWNYIPHINACEDGLENYQRFCRARSLAFEARFGQHFQQVLPSSSAVGASGGPLTVAFVAGPSPPRYFENPSQIPAFNYPPEHGPRPPSFSRATRCDTCAATHVFISGTAAIRGHATVAPGDLDAQVTCTFENLRSIGQACGVGAALGGNGEWQRTFKVYLRCREDLSRVIKRIEGDLLCPGDQVLYLRADICRSELVFEIEVRLASVAPHQGNGRHRLPPRF